jgi:hypothetical protein
MSIPVRVPYNPVLSRMLDGQLYAISGPVWIPVPDGTTRADLPMYMTWERPGVASDAPQAQRWTVSGSKGKTYRVEEYGGAWRCSCPGYQYRRKCRHITERKALCSM